MKLSSFRGKYVLIDFWASWCEPCRKEIPNIKQVYNSFADKGLVVIGVSVDQHEGEWAASGGRRAGEIFAVV